MKQVIYMLTIDFLDEESYTTEKERADIETLINYTYDYLKNDKDAEVSISFVSEEEIQAINRDYRDKDEVTDVISFALLDDDSDVDIIGMPVTLGDIIINTNRADEQAKEYNHSYKRELMFLSLHGFLHLLGFDHMNEEDEKEMFGLQKEILDAFGLSRD